MIVPPGVPFDSFPSSQLISRELKSMDTVNSLVPANTDCMDDRGANLQTYAVYADYDLQVPFEQIWKFIHRD